MKWLYSYETLLFDTPSGDLTQGYFAVEPLNDKKIYRHPDDDGVELSKLQQVAITGKGWFQVFQDSKGVIHREAITKNDYTQLALKGAGKPIKKDGNSI